MSILDLESGKRFKTVVDAARGLKITVEEVRGLLACGWLVCLRPPPLLLPKGALRAR